MLYSYWFQLDLTYLRLKREGTPEFFFSWGRGKGNFVEMSTGAHPFHSHYCRALADVSQDQYPVCSKLLGSSVPQAQRFTVLASIGVFPFLDFLRESPLAAVLYHCFLRTLIKDHKTTPFPHRRRPAQPQLPPV